MASRKRGRRVRQGGSQTSSQSTSNKETEPEEEATDQGGLTEESSTKRAKRITATNTFHAQGHANISNQIAVVDVPPGQAEVVATIQLPNDLPNLSSAVSFFESSQATEDPGSRPSAKASCKGVKEHVRERRQQQEGSWQT